MSSFLHQVIPGHSLCTRRGSRLGEYRNQQNKVPALKELTFQGEETDSVQCVNKKMFEQRLEGGEGIEPW